MLTEHKTSEVNEAISIEPDERDPNNGGASHVYDVTWMERDGSGMHVEIPFQRGPIKENGVNGMTNEVLLAIVADRLRGFQSSQWACSENAAALAHIEEAIDALHERTRKRVARGVEGTSAV